MGGGMKKKLMGNEGGKIEWVKGGKTEEMKEVKNK